MFANATLYCWNMDKHNNGNIEHYACPEQSIEKQF